MMKKYLMPTVLSKRQIFNHSLIKVWGSCLENMLLDRITRCSNFKYSSNNKIFSLTVKAIS